MVDSLKDPVHGTVNIASLSQSLSWMLLGTRLPYRILNQCSQQLYTTFLAERYAVLCYTPCFVLAHTPVLGFSISFILHPLRDSNVVFHTAHIKSVMSQITQGAPHLYYLKLNSLYPSILQPLSPLCVVTLFP